MEKRIAIAPEHSKRIKMRRWINCCCFGQSVFIGEQREGKNKEIKRIAIGPGHSNRIKMRRWIELLFFRPVFVYKRAKRRKNE